ncbi:MAG TPA: aminotransferase class I/II-fold pyridoxal phosphate-dependent enzyme [Thermoanaerobaculia bacterium]|nr:aminotransferase class I/II-fold pyridoxal phosphate-dependent enzyme [Thermoanaerobaculia bacterium]
MLVAAPFADRVSALGTENAFKIGPWIREVEARGKRVIRCNLGEPDFPLPKHIADEVKRAIDLDQTHYVDPQGIEPLRAAIAKNAGEARGIRITPDRVVVFPGAKPPIGFAEQVYCNPGDEVIYPSPGFPIYESFTSYLGARPVPMHFRDECTARDLAPLISDRTRLIFLNFPSNPTGGVATREQLEEFASVIRKCDARVYSDEVYERIIFGGAQHHSIASIRGMEERTIIVSGVSKTYAWTGGRVGWAILPTAEEAAVFRNLNINYFSCVPAYNQLGAKLAIESPESEREIRRMVDEFERRRDFIVPALNAIDGITCRLPRGAFYVFPNIAGVCERLGTRDPFASTLFQMFLLFEYGVATLDRKSFGVAGAEGKHFLRLSIATSFDDLREAVARIEAAANDRAGFERFVAERGTSPAASRHPLPRERALQSSSGEGGPTGRVRGRRSR